MIEAFLTVWVGVCIAQASPGPNLVAVARVGLGQGRRAALFVTSGITSGILIWATGAAYGLGALLDAVPVVLTLLKFVGGGYLLFLAIGALAAAWRGDATTIKASADDLTDLEAWRRGFFVVITNPKAALMWSAVATFLFGAGLTSEQVLLFGPIGAFSAAIIYGTYAILFSTGHATRGYASFGRVIEAAFGAIFGVLGAKLVGDGLRELRS